MAELKTHWGSYLFMVAGVIKIITLLFRSHYEFALWVFFALVMCGLSLYWEKEAWRARTWK